MLEISNIKKDYQLKDETVHALNGVSICFRRNEFVSILGPSGSGKSTLLNLIGGIETSEKGKIQIGNIDISNMSIYDLIINTGTFDPEKVSEIILTTLKVI